MKKINKLFDQSTFIKVISIVSIIYLLYYLWWRAEYTLNPVVPFFSWLLWGAEAFGVLSYILFSWLTQDISPTRSYVPPRPGIRVDVFIPTYNEDLEILEATMVGCKNIRYPHKTYVLDDGRRESVKQLAERLGCYYLTRPTNEHAKAGNINYALQHTDGEFIVILDADMVPQPDFIERTLGYFEDENLALIQLPQEFYNHDSIQHDKKRRDWHEQSLFFRVIQPGKNHSNSAFWCGSPSIVRRKAIESVGGVATETITEDIHTSVRLHSRGWSTYFLNEELAYGIAPQTIQAFLLQRLRWAQGTMQLYRSKESPLWIPGLTLGQRLSYLASFLAYFESFQKLILILTPLLILLGGIFPMKIEALPFILHWAPYFLLNILANQVGGRGYFRYFQTEKYNILKMIVFIQSTLTLIFSRPLKFKVTPKSVDDSVYAKERKALRSYMVILGVLIGAIIYGLSEMITHHGALAQNSPTNASIALFWASYNAYIILTAVREILRKPHERKQYRFPAYIQGDLYDLEHSKLLTKVEITDISISGAGLKVKHSFPEAHGKLALHFDTPTGKCIVLPLKNIHRKNKMSSDSLQLGVSFIAEDSAYRENLFEFLFIYLARQQYEIPGSQKSKALSSVGEPSPLFGHILRAEDGMD